MTTDATPTPVSATGQAGRPGEAKPRRRRQAQQVYSPDGKPMYVVRMASGRRFYAVGPAAGLRRMFDDEAAKLDPDDPESPFDYVVSVRRYQRVPRGRD